MLTTLFEGLFDTAATTITAANFMLVMVVSMFIGLFLSGCYMYKNRHTASFSVTLALLPAAVSMVIMMVNGNIGAGVAVAGAFGLVRFRSAQGNAKDITAIFTGMAAGLAAGMGYLGYAVLFTLIIGLILILLTALNFGETRNPLERTLRITIPEDLDYSTVFDDLMENYTAEYKLMSVKTANMGSLFKLTYSLTLKDGSAEKEFIDELRIRNGNLEIAMNREESLAAPTAL